MADIDFLALPLDILLNVLRYLTVRDTVRLGQVCQSLRNVTNERSIWVHHNSLIPTPFPQTLPSPLTTDELRWNVVREAKVSSRWKSCFQAPHRYFKLFIDGRLLRSELLPGGQCIALLYTNGSVGIRVVDDVNQTACASFVISCESRKDSELHICSSAVFPTSERGGYVMVEVVHLEVEDIGHQHSHVGIFEYHLQPFDISVALSNHFMIPSNWDLVNWSIHGETIALLQEDNNSNYLFVSSFDIPSTPRGAVIPPIGSQPNFELTGLSSVYQKGSTAFSLVSRRRIILAGPEKCIYVFDLPKDVPTPIGGRARALNHSWTYSCTSSHSGLVFQCSAVFYSDHDPSPKIWILQRRQREIHYFRFSTGEEPGESPVEEHRHLFPSVRLAPALGCSRLMWCDFRNHRVNLLTLSEFLEEGNFPLLKEGRYEYWKRFSFDELSGRVSFMPLQVMDNSFILVGDLIEA